MYRTVCWAPTGSPSIKYTSTFRFGSGCHDLRLDTSLKALGNQHEMTYVSCVSLTHAAILYM